MQNTNTFESADRLALSLLAIQPDKPILDFDELMSRPRTFEQNLLEPYLPKIGLGVIAGAPDCGKSLLARQLALAVAGGLDDFCGLRLAPSHSSAIFVSTEDTIDDAQAVIERQASGLGLRNASPGLRYSMPPALERTP